MTRRSWTTEQQRIERRRPIPAAGWGLLAGGAGLMVAGMATRDYKTYDPLCGSDGRVTTENQAAVPVDCPPHDNTTSNVLVLTGAIALVSGLVALQVNPSQKIEILHSEPHTETTSAPCISSADLATLSLLLKVSENKFVHVEVEPNGDASIPLATPASLPRAADLPIVVYRAPRAAAGLLQQWQVVGTLHTPD